MRFESTFSKVLPHLPYVTLRMRVLSSVHGPIGPTLCESDIAYAFTVRQTHSKTDSPFYHIIISYDLISYAAGRDSVRARQKQREVTSQAHVTADMRDADFLSRIEAQLIRDRSFFDMDVLRNECQMADHARTGNISVDSVSIDSMCMLAYVRSPQAYFKNEHK